MHCYISTALTLDIDIMTILDDVELFKLRKNEKFFSRAQCIALSPDEKQVMVGTNLGEFAL